MLSRPAVQMGAVVCTALAVRLYRLSSWDLTVDEGFGLHAAALSFGGMLRFIASYDSHPPLFYIMLWAWVRAGLGDSTFTLRLLPLIFGVASAILAYLIGKSLLDQRVAFLGALLIALSPFLIRWSQEARMYSLLPLLSLCSLYALVEISTTGSLRSWIGYGVVTAAGLYTTYAFVFTLLAYQVIALWWWVAGRGPNPKKWLICHGLVILAVLPWAFLAWGQMDERIGVAAPMSSIMSLPFLVQNFTSGPLPYHAPLLKVVVVATAVIVFLRVSDRLRDRQAAISALVAATMVPLSLGTVIVLRSERAVQTLRLFTGVAVPWLLCLAAGIMTTAPRVRTALIALVCGANLLSIGLWLPAGYPYVVDWQRVAAHITSASSPQAIVVGAPGWNAYTLDYYFRKLGAPIQTFAFWNRRDTDDLRRAIRGKEDVWLSTRGPQSDFVFIHRLVGDALMLRETVQFVDSRLEHYRAR
jgi:mannosyltransferase